MPMNVMKLRESFIRFTKRSQSRVDDLTEEELRRIFTDAGIVGSLGYQEIGGDIRFEKTIRRERKRPDIQCLDEYGNVVFVTEFKKPADRIDLRRHYDQLWDSYVLPLKARFGVLTNGLHIVVFERIGINSQILLEKNIKDLSETDFELILSKLQKPSYDTTIIDRVMTYFRRFSETSECRPLTTELARQLFFEDFVLAEDSPFSSLVSSTMGLFDCMYGESKFLTSAYDFWLKSYAKKPGRIPDTWKRILRGQGLSLSQEDLSRFMFSLETAYALFTRLILAKACEDHMFPHIDFYDFMNTIKTYSWRGDIPLVAWGILLTQWIDSLRQSLVESVFEEDIFYWWTDKFSEMQSWSTNDLFSGKVDEKLFPFCKAIARMMFTLYKYDFSKIAGDPLGDLYQRYFDKETRKALGEFYTPKEIVDYILDAVNYKGEFIADKRLLDPACGSGTFIVEALKRYLKSAEGLARERGWSEALKKLCNEFHIVGFDIHPFATIMSQIHFMLVLIPYYKRAIEEEKTFVLRRIPIFRTDSLIDERTSEETNLTMYEEDRSGVRLRISLPIRRGVEGEFIEIKIVMPRSQEVWNKTDLKNIPEYFCALQAVFDIVKHQVRNDKYEVDKALMERRMKEYLEGKKWKLLVEFFGPYADRILLAIRDLKYQFGDGRLVKSVEDIMLAGLLKNFVEYDFVVGNPPYVRVQTLDPDVNKRLRENYTTVFGKFDLYVPFVERGISWLREKGTLGYINPNLFFYRDYGRKLREFISRSCTIRQIIDFGDSGVFREVTNYPCIMILEKSPPRKNTFKCVRIARPKDEILDDIRTDITLQYHRDRNRSIFEMDQALLGGDPWKLAPAHVLRVVEKIEKSCSHRLGALAESIYEGFISGANSIFFLEGIGYQELNLESEMLKRVPKGKNVRRWRIKWKDRHVIYPQKDDGQPLSEEEVSKNHPKTFAYLSKYKKRLKVRRYYGQTPQEMFGVWFSLVHPKPTCLFEQLKIVTPNLAAENNFALDDEGYFLDHDCYGIILANKERKHYLFVLALLNSDVLEFYLKQISPFASGKYYRYMTGYLDRLPIKLPVREKEKNVATHIVRKAGDVLRLARLQEKMDSFPHSYLENRESVELDHVLITFRSGHRSIEVALSQGKDEAWNLSLGRRETPVKLETRARAEYLSIALSGQNVKKGEKVKVFVPKDEHIVEEVLDEYQHDAELLERTPIHEAESEINELVHKLYSLDKNDVRIIEEVLEVEMR